VGWLDDGHEIMRVDMRLRNLNSGAEQLFVRCATVETTVIPEPATLFLVGSGLIGLAGLGRRRLRKRD
jgi:hypothetical protein